MMELSRTGEKVTINHRGIFKKFSQDRYDFLRYLLPLLDMLRNLSSSKTSIEITSANLHINDKELLEKLVNNSEDKIETLYKYIDEYKAKIDSDIQAVRDMKFLSNLEKDIYISNIKIMREYLIQRRFNKALYHLCIDEARRLMLRKEVSRLVTSSNSEYMHILNSLKNDIKAVRSSTAIKVLLFEEGNRDYLLLSNPNYI